MVNVEEKVREVLAKRIDLSKATPETKLEDLNIDSLDLVETMMDIEEAFNITFDNDEIVGLKCVNDILKLIEKKLQK